jgi:hypothetical protein
VGIYYYVIGINRGYIHTSSSSSLTDLLSSTDIDGLRLGTLAAKWFSDDTAAARTAAFSSITLYMYTN